MRNFKNTFVILLLLSLFSCNTQSISEDEIPEIASKAGGSTGINGNFNIAILEITVQYHPTHNRNQIRSIYGASLGLINYVPCVNEPSKEVWRIPYITQTELTSIINSTTLGTPLYTIAPPTASNGGGGDDDMAGQIEEVGAVSTIPTRFMYANTCN
ncbi:MAG: hypothetical protein HEP71_29315 [Roseivirga sp.]|nr:hypothetical protein [Roseivirga sp.]